MASAPRDGTMLRLLVAFEEHATEDAEEATTIGANNFDNDEHDEWKFAGWCWTHDHFTQGIGTPIGWLPMIETEQPAPVAVVLPEFEPEFEAWWESDGQYCRAGGGSYEKTFAYRAYEAALDKVKELNS